MTERDLMDEIIRTGVIAADMEMLNTPPPLSSIRNPDGSLQYETQAERTRRLVNVAIRHVVDNGLLVVAPDAEERFEQGISIAYKP